MDTNPITFITTIAVPPFKIDVYFNGASKQDLSNYFCRFGQVRMALGGFGGHLRQWATARHIGCGPTSMFIRVSNLPEQLSAVIKCVNAWAADTPADALTTPPTTTPPTTTPTYKTVCAATTAHILMPGANRSKRVSVYHNGECRNTISNYFCRVSQVKLMIMNHANVATVMMQNITGSIDTFMSVAVLARCGDFSQVINSIADYIAKVRKHEETVKNVKSLGDGTCNIVLGTTVFGVNLDGANTVVPTGAADTTENLDIKPAENAEKNVAEKPEQSNIDALFAMKPEPQTCNLASVKGKSGVYVLKITRGPRVFYRYACMYDLGNVTALINQIREDGYGVDVVSVIVKPTAIGSAMVGDMAAWVTQNNCGFHDQHYGNISLMLPSWDESECCMLGDKHSA